MNLKKKIAEKEEARLGKQVKAINAKYAEKPAQEKKRGRKKKTATTEESSAAVSEMEKTQTEFIPNFWTHPGKESSVKTPDQSAKADCGKLHISYVPTEIIEAIAKVREFAHNKYGDGADRWFEIDKSRYREALLRHVLRWWKNPDGKDEESGLPHLWHIACNVSFLVSLEDNNAD